MDTATLLRTTDATNILTTMPECGELYKLPHIMFGYNAYNVPARIELHHITTVCCLCLRTWGNNDLLQVLGEHTVIWSKKREQMD
jgi:hypothetical protein